jgi:hypothetical protein
MTRHHRKPKSLGGGRNKRNISLLPNRKHIAWHILFANWPAHKIAEEINARYIDPEFRLVLERRSSHDP